MLDQLRLYKYLRPLLWFCWMWIFPWIKLSWHSCSGWGKRGWLNWFWQFLCEGLSSFNLKRFYHSFAWFCILCERRTSFCMWHIWRKLRRFLLMFLTGFISLSVLFHLPLLIIFIVMHGFWFCFWFKFLEIAFLFVLKG